LISWFLRVRGIENIRVYAIDDRADVPAEIVAPVHADINKRGRIVGLASQITDDDESRCLTCIIDADFDIFEPLGAKYPHLLRTDFAAMEIYALHNESFDKFLALNTTSSESSSELLASLSPVWQALFAVRYVLKSANVSLVSRFWKSLSESNGTRTADLDYLLRQSAPAERQLWDDLRARVENLLETTTFPALQGIRGHDVAPVLRHFLKFHNTNITDSEVEDLLRTSIEVSALALNPMFLALEARAST